MAAFDRHKVLPATEKDAALRRIGYYQWHGQKRGVAEWNILQWFVKLARDPRAFADMAQSEVELLRLEYRALQEEAISFYDDVLTVEALEKFRGNVRRHLEELADTGKTEFGPFPVRRIVLRQGSAEEGRRLYSSTLIEPWQGEGLLHLLSQLVETVTLPVLRCPRCHDIFLQPRRDAQFCSRACQANAYARTKREEALAHKKAKTMRKGGLKQAARPIRRKTLRG